MQAKRISSPISKLENNTRNHPPKKPNKPVQKWREIKER
jgi:hypothetical protein